MSMSSLSLIEAMHRELKSIYDEIQICKLIIDDKERRLALEELKNERDIIVSFYESMIASVGCKEQMSIDEQGRLKIDL